MGLWEGSGNTLKRVALIGSSQYRAKFFQHARDLEKAGCEVKIPAFDDMADLDELGVCSYNLECIKWAEEVHVIWDQRSIGTIFDFGMCFALNKPIIIVYIEAKTFKGVFEKYAANCTSRTR